MNLKLFLKISLLTLFSLGCSDLKQDRRVSDNGIQIDLTDLNAVKENLDGFWIREDKLAGDNIILLGLAWNKNQTTWEEIPFTEEIKRTQTIPVKSCPTNVSLIKTKDTVQIEFSNLGWSRKTKIDYLSKNVFKVDGITYLRHEGYDFIK